MSCKFYSPYLLPTSDRLTLNPKPVLNPAISLLSILSMASSKLLLNLSGTFLCSYRTSSPSSRRLFPLYPFSPLTKFQSSLRLCTSAATTLSVDSDPSPLSDPSLHAGHPWPEWDSFVNKLKTKGYFDRATTITGKSFILPARVNLQFVYKF